MSIRHLESVINGILLGAIVLTLGLLILWGYLGREEQSGHYYRYGQGGSHHIADITVNLGGTPKQEHCLTCHPEGKSAARRDRSLPGPSHPNIDPHSIYDLGCTGCHLGEGMAADLTLSHGRTGDEARKILAGEDLQASCYQCHALKPLRGAEKAWQGFQLFSETACDTCHAWSGLRGAGYGPDLSDVGSFLGLRQIRTVIENPKAQLVNAIMPKFSLAPEEIKALSYFLKSRVKNPPYETPMMGLSKKWKQERMEEKGGPEGVLVGEALFKEKKCLACHKFGEADGRIGPDLSYTAFMRSKDYIRNFLHSPGSQIPGAIMPKIPMSQREEEALVRILQQKTEVPFHQRSAKNAYMMLCQRCHAAQGDGFGVIQPNLATFPRAFRNSTPFFHSIPDTRIMGSLTKGIPGTSMPPYGILLGQKTINVLVDLLFQVFIRTGRINKDRPVSLLFKPSTLPQAEQNMALFRKRCSLCHGPQGKGKGPDFLKYLPRPRDLTNAPYFGSLADERIAKAIAFGVPGTGMGPFHDKMDTESIWGQVSLVRKFSRQREIDDNGL